MKIFTPSINFFGKLSFQKKIVVMMIAVLLPFIMPSYVTYKSFFNNLNLVKKEIIATKYLKVFKELLVLIPKHRGMMEGFLKGEKGFEKDIKKNEKKVDYLFQKIKLLDKKSDLFITDTKRYKKIKKLWEKVKIENIKNKDISFEIHTNIVRNIINYLKYISYILNIRQDKGASNQYIISLLFDTIPKIEEYLGRVRGTITTITIQQNFSEENIEKVHNMKALLFAELKFFSDVIGNIELYEKNKVLKDKFINLKENILNLILITEEIVHQKKVVPPKKYFNQASNVINNIDQFYTFLLNHFQKNLKIKEKKEIEKIILLSISLLFVFLVTNYLFLGFYFSISKPLEKFKKVIHKLLTGNYSVSVDVNTQDEMRNIAFAFNEMIKKIKRNINFLNGYKLALDGATLVTKGDIEGKITYANKEFLKVTGYKLEEILNRPHSILKDPLTPESIYKNLWDTILDKKVWRGILKIKTKDGKTLVTKSTIVPILDENKNIKEFVAIRTDITELIKAQEKIKRMLYFDNLTFLPNRVKLLEDLKKEKPYGIAILNIDDFRQLNDVFGYEAGNFVLKKCAEILKSFQTKDCKVYKLSSDEFALIFFKKKEKEKMLEKVLNVINILEKYNYIYEGYNLKILLRAGVGVIENGNENIEKILLDADTSVKEAKIKKKKVIYYKESESALKEYIKKLEWVDKIKDAINNDKIVPYFQPILNNKTKKIEKYEVLVRLIDKEGKIVSPFFFLDIAKEAKLYNDITKIMIKKSFEVFKDRKEELSINLSVQDILDKDTSKFIIDMIQKYNMENRGELEKEEKQGLTNFVIEITESEEVENYDLIAEFIKKIKEYGGQAAIDDFGTGYSNFVYILNMGIDYLKIDGSLIKNILIDERSETLVKAIVHFTRELGIKTIAEFVSDKEIQEKVEKMGVDYSQGYFISEPVPKEKLSPSQL
ncbi:EAL domain-containing protein [Nitrosophilus kaiyonis]|uniref:EAL domain-containing protein n=1 Tax=Nitrosophilus kaiyonis TaxID=2930200 RepID=UPI0024931032|nr:EAL domain-containing protein [Nitrosophilus kaiyonis]